MSIVLQWIIVGVCLFCAVAYLLRFFGILARLGWVRPDKRGPCNTCAHCPVAVSRPLSDRELHD
jgi:hypothetical protein